MCSIVCAEYLHHALQILQAFQALHSFAACWLGLLWHGTLCRVTWCHCRVTCTAGEVGAKKNCGTSTTHQTALGKCASIPTPRSKLEQRSNRTNTVYSPSTFVNSGVQSAMLVHWIASFQTAFHLNAGHKDLTGRKGIVNLLHLLRQGPYFYHHKKHRLV